MINEAEVTASLKRQRGQWVGVVIPGDPSYGMTMRWGIVRDVTADDVLLSQYQDAHGFGPYPTHRPCNQRLKLAEIREVRPCANLSRIERAAV